MRLCMIELCSGQWWRQTFSVFFIMILLDNFEDRDKLTRRVVLDKCCLVDA